MKKIDHLHIRISAHSHINLSPQNLSPFTSKTVPLPAIMTSSAAMAQLLS
ncbi:hypothetical protein [Mucilaginibacter ginsenosidivorans]|nr:hypothetical protein [Mucilaginibacter ginsenosidivorans]